MIPASIELALQMVLLSFPLSFFQYLVSVEQVVGGETDSAAAEKKIRGTNLV